MDLVLLDQFTHQVGLNCANHFQSSSRDMRSGLGFLRLMGKLDRGI